MSKPTIVFCHGAWHTPSFFDKVIAILEPLGYKCVTFSFPGTGNVPPVKSLDEDIEAVRAVVLKEVDVGADVVVSAHSWGGVPTCSALDGLSKAEREREGKPGGVVKLAFVTSFILPEETSIADALGGPLDVWIQYQKDENLKFPDEVNKEVFYHDLPSDEADEWAYLSFYCLDQNLYIKSLGLNWRVLSIVCLQSQPHMNTGITMLGGKL